jgi:hypothetical protein
MFVGVTLHPAPALSKPGRIAVIAAGADLCTTRNRVPGCVCPFDMRVGRHREHYHTRSYSVPEAFRLNRLSLGAPHAPGARSLGIVAPFGRKRLRSLSTQEFPSLTPYSSGNGKGTLFPEELNDGIRERAACRCCAAGRAAPDPLRLP